MKKLNIAVIFGGKSGEHEVSIVSATSIFKALDKNKYNVTLLGIDKTGRWLLQNETEFLAHSKNPRLLNLNKQQDTVAMIPYQTSNSLVPVQSTTSISPSQISQKFDVVIPVLHGTYGEDGTMQGLFELANIPYVGSGVLGSAVGMDKEFTRKILAAEGIPVVPTEVIRRHEFTKTPEAFIQKMIERLGLPHFIKPANAGSSVGVHKIKDKTKALEQYQDAFKYDTKILVEKMVDARELECSVLGNNEPRVADVIGEISPTGKHEFYSYEAKYIDENGADLKIPAENLSQEMKDRLHDYSRRAFRVLECRGLARVDFFLDRKTGELFLNEVNTFPGFTSISMYPKLWEASGLKYSELLDQLIQLAVERHEERNSLKTSFEV